MSGFSWWLVVSKAKKKQNMLIPIYAKAQREPLLSFPSRVYNDVPVSECCSLPLCPSVWCAWEKENLKMELWDPVKTRWETRCQEFICTCRDVRRRSMVYMVNICTIEWNVVGWCGYWCPLSMDDLGDIGVRFQTVRPMVLRTPTLSVVAAASGPLT